MSEIVLPAIFTDGASDANVIVLEVTALVKPDLCSSTESIAYVVRLSTPQRILLPVNAKPVSFTTLTFEDPFSLFVIITKRCDVPPET